MRRSDQRILTTRTGSLPRPAELTRLYVRRARGESADPAELDRLGRAALHEIVLRQARAGFDTSTGKGRVAEDVVWAKLTALAAGAKVASERLGLG